MNSKNLLPGFTRYDIQRKGYSLALIASICQMLIGPIVLLTLPTKGMGWNLILVIFTGVAMALPAMWMMWKGLQASRENIGKNFYKVVILMSITVVFMGSGRQIYRANALEPHQKLVKLRTEEFQKIKEAFVKSRRAQAAENSADLSLADKGKKVFNQNCAACHKPKEMLVGPPVTEMAAIYKDKKKTDLINWIKKPGKKTP